MYKNNRYRPAVTGLTSAALAEASAALGLKSRPQTSLDTLRLEARHIGSPIVIEHVTGRWLVVLPGGAVLGAGGDAQGAFWAEQTAWEMCGEGDYQVVVDRVVGR